MARVYYTLPFFRFTNFIRLVVFIDGCLSAALWIAGGNTGYMEDSVTHWTITGSVFELACMGLLRMMIFFHLFTKVEDYSLALLENPYNQTLMSKKRRGHIVTSILSFISFAYSVTKGGLILSCLKGSFCAMFSGDSYQLHPTYYALVISSVVFSLFELIASVACPMFMRRLQVLRIQHELKDEEIEEEGKKKKGKADLGRLFALAKAEIWLILLGMIGLVVSSGTTMIVPLFFGRVVDAAVTSSTMDKVNYYILILLGIFICGSLASLVRSWAFTLAGIRVVCRLRRDLFSAIIKQEIAFFDTNRTGELTSRLSSDTQVVQNAVTVNVSMLVRYLFQIFGSVVIMLTQSPSLTGVLLAVVPIVAVGAVVFGRFAQSLQKKFQDALGEASTAAEESISSIRTVRSFVGESKAYDSYSKEIANSYKFGKSLAVWAGVFNGLIGTVSQGAIVLVLWYGGKLVQGNEISVGKLTAFMLYTLNVAMAFAFLASLYGDFMKAVGASVRIFELIDRKPGISLEGGAKPFDFGGDIVFNEVFFTYPSRPDSQVLKGVSFDVKPGEVVALVGPSGGGKSTIVNLIENFYLPGDGEIRLGGHNLIQLDPQFFRRKISIVSQEPVLFACSIKDNIAYGKEATEEEIIDAAKKANAHEFISSFEEGYETLVGERGVRLSGGQKQRVAIARALIMDPSILLLDEATSALDAESEHLVQEAIDRAMEGRTVLVIAHRLSTVRTASKVVVIKHGAVAESGTHDQLIAKGGVYKKLVLRQLTSAEDRAAIINADPADLGEQSDSDDSDTEEKPEA